jgi:GNAT superfamily N-acetyltransferase
MTERYIHRRATANDIAILVRHRRLMMAEIAVGVPESVLDAMDTAYAAYLQKQLCDGTTWAWVAEANNTIIASAAVSMLSWPPEPGDTSEEAALLHSMYTEPQHRRRGLARLIAETAIQHCRESGFKWITLDASEAGRALYESLGFSVNQSTTMELRL